MAPLCVVLLWALLLLAFAYARGVSELQALSFDVGLGASESVWLHVIPDFVDGSVLAGVAPRSFVVPTLVFGLGFVLWTVFCALFERCSGLLSSLLGRVRSY